MRQSVEIIRGICQDLELAHHHAIVHGQIAPKSIILDRQGGFVLADLGLSLVSPPLISPRDAVVEFTAPELWNGRSALATTAADGHALGATLKHLLMSGRLSQIRRASQPPASLLGIIDKAMQTDPAQRYGTAGPLGEALLRWRRSDRWRRGWLVALLVAVVALLI